MMNDAVPPIDYLTPYDSFTTFDIDGRGSINLHEFKQVCSVSADTCICDTFLLVFHHYDTMEDLFLLQ
jgi:Ca2+-binding EF-hand superfamily protein